MKIEEFAAALKQLMFPAETADVLFGEQTVRFAEGVETEVEVARSGKFVDMNRQTVEVTPDLMRGLAGTFNPTEHEPKLKLGHEPIKTDTPDYGSVVGLSYDETKDRLMAKIRPTLALVKKVREGSFNQRSMEFAVNPKTGPRFLHLGFLGARKPAISGLAPVALAGEETVVESVVFTDPEPAEVPATLSAPEPEPSAIDGDAKNRNVEQMQEKTNANEEIPNMSDPKTDRLKAQLAAASRDRVKAFLSANGDRIPMSVQKLGLEDALVSMLAAEVEVDTPETVKLAGPEGEKQVSPSDFCFAVLAALPAQVAVIEKKEIADKGADAPVVDVSAFASADPASVKYHLAVEQEIAEAKTAGEVIPYLEGVRRVESKQRATK